MEEAYLFQGYHLHCPFKSSCKLNFHPACHHQGWASWNWSIPLQQDPAIQPTCCDQGTTGTDDTLQLSPAISAASLSRLGLEEADGLRQGRLALLMSKISSSASLTLTLDPTYILAFPSSIAGFHRFNYRKTWQSAGRFKSLRARMRAHKETPMKSHTKSKHVEKE